MRQILQKRSKDNFVEIITIESSDKNPLKLTARHFPSIYTGSSDRRSVACSKNDDEKVTVVVKFIT